MTDIPGARPCGCFSVDSDNAMLCEAHWDEACDLERTDPLRDRAPGILGFPLIWPAFRMTRDEVFRVVRSVRAERGQG